jgi:hypothetical protein
MISDKESRADLTVVGDVMPGRKVAQSLQRIGPDRVASRLQTLLTGTVAVGNLECALCDNPVVASRKRDGGPNLHAPTATARWLRKAGFDVLSLGNNHVMDCGPRGLLETIQSLHRAGIRTVGAGRNLNEAISPLILDCGVRRVALLGFGNGLAAGRRSPGVAPFQSDALRDGLAEVPSSVDATIVLFHTGLEFLEYPESWIREFAEEAVSGGADCVIGTHPHCIRGVIQSETATILYGLGDFMMDTADQGLLKEHLARTALRRLGHAGTGAENCHQGLAADIVLDEPRALRCRLIPLLLDEDYLPRLAEKNEQLEIMERIWGLSAPIGDPNSPQMQQVRRIEQEYRRAYGDGRRLKDWFTLPFRLCRRHAGSLLRPGARRIGRSRKTT